MKHDGGVDAHNKHQPATPSSRSSLGKFNHQRKGCIQSTQDTDHTTCIIIVKDTLSATMCACFRPSAVAVPSVSLPLFRWSSLPPFLYSQKDGTTTMRRWKMREKGKPETIVCIRSSLFAVPGSPIGYSTTF